MLASLIRVRTSWTHFRARGCTARRPRRFEKFVLKRATPAALSITVHGLQCPLLAVPCLDRWLFQSRRRRLKGCSGSFSKHILNFKRPMPWRQWVSRSELHRSLGDKISIEACGNFGTSLLSTSSSVSLPRYSSPRWAVSPALVQWPTFCLLIWTRKRGLSSELHCSRPFTIVYLPVQTIYFVQKPPGLEHCELSLGPSTCTFELSN